MKHPQEVVRRRPVWAALSELFLDTELQSDDHVGITGVLIDSGYSIDELEHILRAELAPVLIDNMCMAGEWQGFDQDWLAQSILQRRKSWRRFFTRFMTLGLIRGDWGRVRRLLEERQADQGDIS